MNANLQIHPHPFFNHFDDSDDGTTVMGRNKALPKVEHRPMNNEMISSRSNNFPFGLKHFFRKNHKAASTVVKIETVYGTTSTVLQTSVVRCLGVSKNKFIL